MLKHANGYTLTQPAGRFNALVVDGDRIVAVGDGEELATEYAGRIAHVLDVEGATVVPGFVDSHLHVHALGIHRIQLNLEAVRHRGDLLAAIADHAASLPADAWVLGGGWNENHWLDQTLPTMEELTQAAGGRPLLLTRICHHVYLVNEPALRLAGIHHDTPNPADGAYGRDAKGRLNGLVYDNAVTPLQRAVPDLTVTQWEQVFRAGMEDCLAAGITAVHTDDVRGPRSFATTWSLYHRLIHEARVRIRVHELVDWNYLDECRAALTELPAPDDWLEVGAAKLFSDGSFGGRTAWLLEDYSDQPGWRGTPMYTPEALAERVRMAHEKGFGAAVHAIGDAALEMVIGALAEAPPVAMRDRIIHAELVHPSLMERMRALGERVVLDIQPRFTVSDFPWLVERLGPTRAERACAWRTLWAAGLRLAGGSDAPIEPVAPLLGIHAAVARKRPGMGGQGYLPAEALTPYEAVQLFTRNACYANGTEQRKGQIAPGFLADLTILDRDIVQPQDVDDLCAANVLYTVVGGEVAYAADGTRTEWSA
ncbi:amidohydrolase [Alicyclobacillus contaminans]|uniref:amidohydrolase n=1 Tax=Alicyclobacillus contaminans TaxID=392016 RepID=UPI0005555E15|nr:amidohydrolase [Alicyclobacillus contaminans]GMA50384.1 amidohydrolase [Alicyclobacillus contaminans]